MTVSAAVDRTRVDPDDEVVLAFDDADDGVGLLPERELEDLAGRAPARTGRGARRHARQRPADAPKRVLRAIIFDYAGGVFIGSVSPVTT